MNIIVVDRLDEVSRPVTAPRFFEIDSRGVTGVPVTYNDKQYLVNRRIGLDGRRRVIVYCQGGPKTRWYWRPVPDTGALYAAVLAMLGWSAR